MTLNAGVILIGICILVLVAFLLADRYGRSSLGRARESLDADRHRQAR